MAHEKLYGICEDKCRVEIFSKDSAFGINKMIVDTEDHSNVGYPAKVPLDGERRVYTGTSFYLSKIGFPDEIPIGYYGEIIIKLTRRESKPGLYIAGSKGIKFLNPDLDTSDFDVLHYHFSYDGFNICYWCAGGYAE